MSDLNQLCRRYATHPNTKADRKHGFHHQKSRVLLYKREKIERKKREENIRGNNDTKELAEKTDEEREL